MEYTPPPLLAVVAYASEAQYLPSSPSSQSIARDVVHALNESCVCAVHFPQFTAMNVSTNETSFAKFFVSHHILTHHSPTCCSKQRYRGNRTHSTQINLQPSLSQTFLSQIPRYPDSKCPNVSLAQNRSPHCQSLPWRPASTFCQQTSFALCLVIGWAICTASPHWTPLAATMPAAPSTCSSRPCSPAGRHSASQGSSKNYAGCCPDN